MLKFTRDLIYVKSTEEKKVYDVNAPPPDVTKNGQLKLLITEILFLVECMEDYESGKLKVVYVGAAPGNHITTLCKIFPKLTFILYDNGRWNNSLKSLAKLKNSNVKLISSYFTEADCDLYAKESDNIIFISDIRNLEYDVRKDPELAEDTTWNDMLLQQTWVKRINPRIASLKFRLPYDTEYNKTKFGGETVKYLSGKVMIQPWTSQTSSECRLIVKKNARLKTWNYFDFSGILYARNTEVRPKIFINPVTNDASIIPTKTMSFIRNDFDTVLTLYIAKKFLEKFKGGTPSAIDVSNELDSWMKYHK